MDPDATFRPVLIACFVAVLLIALYHRLRAATREPLDRRKEGMFILATLRPIGLVLFGSVIAYMIDPAWMAWSSLPLPAALRWTGAGLCAMTACLLFWTMSSLGPNLTDTVVTRRAHTLVTTGPYRWVRHPFYDCMALFVLSLSLVAANWFMLAAGIVLFILLAIRSRTEEAELLARFGQPYREYRSSTGRFLPRLMSPVR